MKYENQTLSTEQVDDGDRFFQISTNTDIESLTASIDRFGLIQPPVLIPRGDRFRIVCGFRRVKAVHRLQWRRLPARVLPDDTPGGDLARLAVADNLGQRSLNLLEIARSLHLLSISIPDSGELRAAAAALGLPAAPRDIAKFLEVQGLPASVRNGLADGGLSLQAALQMGEFQAGDADRLMDVMRDCRPSVNRQREILLFVKEIAKRENRTASAVLDEPDFRKIVENKEADGNRKAREIRDYLKQRRFPALSDAEAAYRRRVAAFRLPEGVRLDPPPHFEGDQYQLSFRFRDAQQLQNMNRYIEKLLERSDFEGLFRRS